MSDAGVSPFICPISISNLYTAPYGSKKEITQVKNGHGYLKRVIAGIGTGSLDGARITTFVKLFVVPCYIYKAKLCHHLTIKLHKMVVIFRESTNYCMKKQYTPE